MREVRNNAARSTMFSNLLRSEPQNDHDVVMDVPSSSNSGDSTPYEVMSPWNQVVSPYTKSPWLTPSHMTQLPPTTIDPPSPTQLVGSLVREEGHVYSLATLQGLLYTGSDSKNIRVWKNGKEFSGFKSSSGLVKAVVIAGNNRIYTGHQDGRIRVWRVSGKNPTLHKRVGTLPKLTDYVKSSFNPSNYVVVRRKHNELWIKHFDAVSCLSLSQDNTILYSGSWDKTVKVWRTSDSKCLESINAHDDAVNSVVAGFNGLVFSGSADGTVKAWRRVVDGKETKHVGMQTLLTQDSAVTALAVNETSSVLYCGSSDGLVNFWEMEKYCCVLSHGGVLRGHKLAVLCLAAKGSLVLSGSADKTICVWRRTSGGGHSCMSVLGGHMGPVKCLAMEVDEESTAKDERWTVYSGSLDRSVKVWKVSNRYQLEQ